MVLGIVIGILLALKFILFYQDYAAYHKIVDTSTFLIYLLVIGATTYFFVKKKKVILANIGVFIFFLIALEFVSYLVLGLPIKEYKSFEIIELHENHKGNYLGSIPWGDSVMHDIQLWEGDTFINTYYTIDKYNRRETPNHDSSKSKHAIFFGCSVCFGYGLEDDQTIPYLIQERLGDCNAYNYAFNGWGPHHMLSLLEHEDLTKQVGEKEGFAAYLFLWSHIRRAIGDYQVYTGWGHSMPYYTIENQQIVFKGNFAEDRPYLSRIYELLTKSYTVRLFKLNFPLNTNENHYELVAEMIKQSEINYKKQFPKGTFVVFIYPDLWKELEDMDQSRLDMLLAELTKRDIKYYNFSELSHLIQGSYILVDGHPTAKSNYEFAEIVVRSMMSK